MELKYKKIFQVTNMVILVKRKEGQLKPDISCHDQGKLNIQLQGYRENGNQLLPLLGYGEWHEDKWTKKGRR